MKNIYSTPEMKLISLLAKSAICAGEDDGVNGGQEGELPELSGFFDDDTVIGG